MGAPRYRKRPVVIEAYRFTDDDDAVSRILSWAGEAITGVGMDDETSRPSSLYIATLEGVMEARVGDWVVKGVEAEVYPCKDSVFQATYEEA